ncbi:MAG: LysE family translocator [Cellvibrionaceae bacterium]
MTIEMLPLFVATIFILAVLPGPGVLLTVARATSGGMSNACFTVAGILVGDIIFILLVTLGLKFVAESLSSLFIVIKYAGSAYLIWLGLSLILSKNEISDIKLNQVESQNINDRRGNNKGVFIADFLAGVAVTLSNPKAIVFYLSFFPAFMDITTLTAIDISIITVIITLTIGGAMMAYAIAAIRTQAILSSSGPKNWIKKIAGGLITSTGAWLLIRE